LRTETNEREKEDAKSRQARTVEVFSHDVAARGARKIGAVARKNIEPLFTIN
jgi:hypothetical protein